MPKIATVDSVDRHQLLDFLKPRHKATLMTRRSDGMPQLSPVTCGVDGEGRLVVSTYPRRAKTANARRDPRVSLHVNRSDFYAYAVIEAEAELMPVAAAADDPTVDALVEYYRSVAGEHPNWDEYRQAMVDDGRLVLKLNPTRAYGMVG